MTITYYTALTLHYTTLTRPDITPPHPTTPLLTLYLIERKLPDDHWRDPQNRRAFFDEFAKEKGFDPSDTEAWYAVQFTELAEKHVRTLPLSLFLLLCNWPNLHLIY